MTELVLFVFINPERKNKELAFQIDEDKKNQQRMTELASALQSKIKTYKKQIEEAEEIAALNLAKFRKAQQELEESEERANLAGSKLSTNTTLYCSKNKKPWILDHKENAYFNKNTIVCALE